jgi:hypothetical protein
VILASSAPIPSLFEITQYTLIIQSLDMSRAPEHKTILSSGYRAFRYSARTHPLIADMW